MNKEKVLNLAKLARIKISDAEAESLSHEFDSILDYVGQIKNAGFKVQDLGLKNEEKFPIRNVLRKDGEPHESGIYTEGILAQAPARDGNYIKVKKIL
ncbi:MAG: Asp-tRNA(Asn)/Glu-tRNA(Gln) amidotransferase subunit GatC [Candidatus Zambryskibacteria bacterium]|nr:Asp-tRNA(Asn)/Glu-tRNA(Gln) amidotransferase subunit GatC [Candidatus Zambryskibacteria bacterium]